MCSDSFAGKTHLFAALVQHLMANGQNPCFAFLSYRDSPIGDIEIIQSFIFQLLHHNHSRQPELQQVLSSAYSSNYHSLKGERAFNQKLFCELLDSVGPAVILVDGLDEVDVTQRRSLLRLLLEILDHCPETKLLISSRNEIDISRILKPKAQHLEIGLRNTQDIELYIEQEIEDWFEMLSSGVITPDQITSMVRPVARKAEGQDVLVLVGYHLSADISRNVSLREISHTQSESAIRSRSL